MNVAGIDYSTHAIDIVLVSLDDGPPAWHRFELVARGELDDAFERTREVGFVVPGRASSFWDDVTAVGIEHPGGKWTGDMLRVQGALLSCIPSHMQVEPWPPAKWRKAVGLPGNASKDEVAEYAMLDLHSLGAPWPLSRFVGQDCLDAYCIALATRQALRREHQGAAA